MSFTNMIQVPPVTPPSGDLKPPTPVGQPKGKPEHYYEPYWDNGDWVFYRNASTRIPTGHILYKGATEHRECNQICINLYEDYGVVCGMRLYSRYDGLHDNDQYYYVFKTFENMCHLELDNCKEKNKTWFPAKKGNCTTGLTKHPLKPEHVIQRLTTWLRNYTEAGEKP